VIWITTENTFFLPRVPAFHRILWKSVD